LLVEYSNGWDGWLSQDIVLDGSIITCPSQIQGIGLVFYQNRVWTSQNGPYVTTTRTLTASRYAKANGFPVVFAATDGARATTSWFMVTCRSLLGIPTFDLMSFVPGGWVITYDPDGPGAGGGGGPCSLQIIYDPDQPCPGTGGPGGTGGGGDDGGGAGCHSEYIFIEISYDGGSSWQTWWEGYATVCG
jgi:hypothetical protein